ncbi:9000_t:CDS:1, partial [Ambispora gerdemannii]
VDSMTPWGVIHGGCCGLRKKVKNKTIKKLYNKVHSPDEEEARSENPSPDMEARPENLSPNMEADINKLKKRVENMEKFTRYIENNFINTIVYEEIKMQQPQQQEGDADQGKPT